MKLSARSPFLLAFFGILAGGCAGSDSPEEAAAMQTSEQPDTQSLQARFVGNWELLSFESFGEDGSAVDNDYIGRLVYDEHGNMSGVGMPRSLPSRRGPAGGELPRAGFGYFSTYEIVPEEGRIIHRVIGSPMNPTWVGTELIRYYEFTEGLLQLSLRNAEGRVTGTLTWRRLEAPATDQIE
jgi:hypothetical protein